MTNFNLIQKKEIHQYRIIEFMTTYLFPIVIRTIAEKDFIGEIYSKRLNKGQVDRVILENCQHIHLVSEGNLSVVVDWL